MDKVQNTANNRFADYFVICGLDLNSGLEPDKFAGNIILLTLHNNFYHILIILVITHSFPGDNLHCSPLERAYKTKILAHYPENVPWNPFDSSAVCLVKKKNVFF